MLLNIENGLLVPDAGRSARIIEIMDPIVHLLARDRRRFALSRTVVFTHPADAIGIKNGVTAEPATRGNVPLRNVIAVAIANHISLLF